MGSRRAHSRNSSDGGSHSGGSAGCAAGTTSVIRSDFRDRSTLLVWDADSGRSFNPDWDGDASVVRRAQPMFNCRVLLGPAAKAYTASSGIGWDFTFSANAVPVPTIMARATIQPAIIFMTQSSWAATLGSSLAKSCDRPDRNALCTFGSRLTLDPGMGELIGGSVDAPVDGQRLRLPRHASKHLSTSPAHYSKVDLLAAIA